MADDRFSFYVGRTDGRLSHFLSLSLALFLSRNRTRGPRHEVFGPNACTCTSRIIVVVATEIPFAPPRGFYTTIAAGGVFSTFFFRRGSVHILFHFIFFFGSEAGVFRHCLAHTRRTDL